MTEQHWWVDATYRTESGKIGRYSARFDCPHSKIHSLVKLMLETDGRRKYAGKLDIRAVALPKTRN